jgi:hypothetical protein
MRARWSGAVNKTSLFLEQLLEQYVSLGGSVLCGICPWGWLSVSHGRSLDDLALNRFVSACGLSFSAEPCALDARAHFSVAHNLAHAAHLGKIHLQN